MYKELLLNHAAANPWLNVQPPAEISEIRRVEAVIGHKFPQELVDLLLELNGDDWLFFSTAQMENTALGTRDAFADCYPGIADHLFFAGNGCGDYYCYNPGEAGILRWDHETNECTPVAADIPELIARYFGDEI